MLDYWDYDALSRKDANGQLLILENHEAIENALRNWFRSFKGEYIRKPNEGGILTKYITKPMTSVKTEDIRTGIRDGLRYRFYPAVTISKIEVTPMYEAGYWDIYIEGYAPLIKKQIKYSDKLKNLG